MWSRANKNKTHALHFSKLGNIHIEMLNLSDASAVAGCIELLRSVFANSPRYSQERLDAEFAPSIAPFYKQFFIARTPDAVIGIGAVKAAEWASHTHLLYLSAVASSYRGMGIGRALLQARIDWVLENFKTGRMLVSSVKAKRFRDCKFKLVKHSTLDGRHLMMRNF